MTIAKWTSEAITKTAALKTAAATANANAAAARASKLDPKTKQLVARSATAKVVATGLLDIATMHATRHKGVQAYRDRLAPKPPTDPAAMIAMHRSMDQLAGLSDEKLIARVLGGDAETARLLLLATGLEREAFAVRLGPCGDHLALLRTHVNATGQGAELDAIEACELALDDFMRAAGGLHGQLEQGISLDPGVGHDAGSTSARIAKGLGERWADPDWAPSADPVHRLDIEQLTGAQQAATAAVAELQSRASAAAMGLA